MSYSKCAMPSLSCLLSSYTIPISLFFELEEFFYFLVSLLFLCMHAYIKSSGFTGGKKTRSLKKYAILLDYVCMQRFMITYTQCFMLIVV